MKELFHLNAIGFPYIDWTDMIPATCSGLIIPDADVAAVQAGFGDMLFQGKQGPLFDAWLSDYDIIHSFTGHSTLDYRSIEVTTLIKNSINYNHAPFGWKNHKEYEVNLAHSLAMDSHVRFEKGVHYSTFDLHFKPGIFKILMDFMPELVYPFLNDYHAGRETSLFGKETFPNQQILHLVRSMIRSITSKDRSSLFFNIRGFLLLAHIFLWNAEITQRRGLSGRQAEIASIIDQITGEITMTDEAFQGIAYYARMAGMSPTLFKKSFQRETGFTVYEFFQNNRFEEVLKSLALSNDSIKAIALDSGFATIQAFDKAFKKKFDISPSDFRKERDRKR
ncbi:helix-turn-helix domain-containing protein [Arachidicoccus terrestris]|uniref:helix-turn-helix domain-containing protein n=1 Tax=Arachidicoccus terrestris TaxID=2875539 RepID=UPI001CC47BB9|nr:response regulator transcription factor [Arachidicoccus terrestris]UAY54194.1 helix-turn-helix domain-containing protein [Arachidicoccus terrestris]